MESLKTLVIERGHIKAALTRFKAFFETSLTKPGSAASLQERLNKKRQLIDRFDEIQNVIETLVAGSEDEQTHLAERENFEDTYFDLVADIQTHLNKCMPQRSVISANVSNIPIPAPAEGSKNIKLQEIPIPHFDGDRRKWIKFRDSFESLVHKNDSLTNIEKYHYLESSISGAAAEVIESLPVSDSSYESAWKFMYKEFEDPKTLIQKHLEALLEVPKIQRESLQSLKQLINNTRNQLASLQTLNEPVKLWDTLLVYILSKKLDHATKQEWDRAQGHIRGKVAYSDLEAFLTEHCKYLERTGEHKAPVQSKQLSTANVRQIRGKTEYVSSHVVTNVNSKPQCPLCKDGHAIFSCEQFRNLTPSNRRDQVAQLSLCFNCLAPGHRTANCNRSLCKKCGRKHNTLLHFEDAIPVTSASGQKGSGSQGQQVVLVNTSSTPVSSHWKSETLLSTAVVYIQDKFGRKHQCRALLDSASHSNFITENLFRLLKIPRNPSDVVAVGLGKATPQISGRADVVLNSRINAFTTSISCLIIPEITSDLPTVAINPKLIPIPNHCVLADPTFGQPGKIDMLIGASHFWDLLSVGQHHMGPSYPRLQKTQLGWILGGRIEVPKLNRQNKSLCHVVTNQVLHDQLQQFWDVEQVNSSQTFDNKHDICEEHFANTTTRDSDGRYIVNIPFKDTIENLGESRNIALKRLIALERKFNRQPRLKQEYCNFMEDYEAQGHMSQVTDEQSQIGRGTYYLPHHAVFKDTSTTTKLRVVFDGSAKSSSGLSLNDVQRVGPVVQDDLLAIILRFRNHRYVLSADIAKMYRQIRIKPEQRQLQQILWRSCETLPVKTYTLNTVTYGTASAPFLATRVLQQVGKDHAVQYPLASRVIIKDFYVDDLLTGTNTIAEARILKDALTSILKTAGFELRKWASNVPERLLLANQSNEEIQIGADKDPKTLGLLWDSHHDTLRFSVQESFDQRVTKRTILSEIARIFDPLGLIGPATVQAKLMLQQLWQLNVSWDESLPQEMYTQWQTFRRELLSINDISIPRHVLSNSQHTRIELHGFCDASVKAYGACIYLRSLAKGKNYTIRLLCAKSRVAPLKTISLPRLELCGAVLLAQLAHKVRESLNFPNCKEFYWCDSTITLAWIRASPSRWQTFVANRVTEIQNLTTHNWNHVLSEHNPADIISRGINPNALASSELWWNGPSWLSKNEHDWPSSDEEIHTIIPEAKISCCVSLATKPLDTSIFHRYSSFNRLLRVITYCYRFINNSRFSSQQKKTANLSQGCAESDSETHHRIIQTLSLNTDELTHARYRLLKLAQEQDFSREIQQLRKGQKLPSGSKLICLHPFLDGKGLLRVGGRLHNSDLSFEEKHPIILHPEHIMTQLIIRDEHIRLLHAGCQSVVNSLRMRYWPLSAKNAVKKILRRCVRCFRVKPVNTEPLMGDLPASRVTPTGPFQSCGVDYAGPFPTKERTRNRITVKSYLCIFVCFTTKAVHFELAIDLSTDAFLNCFKRFISRRGIPRHIYSDNGTNFIGAQTELKDLQTLLSSKVHIDKVTDFCSNIQTHYIPKWHLIPPRAPHFGGLWVSAVKHAKYHLRRVIGETRLTYEELYTVLTQVEACLNSRPLSPLSEDPHDLIPLTPAHFLVGKSLTILPEADIRDLNESRLNRYQHLQQMFQHFWHRWQKEYLQQLQLRHKWSSGTPQKIAVGTLVVIKEDNPSPLRWRLGRVIDLHPGKDNIVRVLSVKTADGIIKRPLVKLCVLPMGDQGDPGAASIVPATKGQ